MNDDGQVTTPRLICIRCGRGAKRLVHDACWECWAEIEAYWDLVFSLIDRRGR